MKIQRTAGPAALLIVTILLLSHGGMAAPQAPADDGRISSANYKLAARFTSARVRKMVFSTSVNPRWMEHSERFWYSFETPDGKDFFIVDPETATREPLFDRVKMAADLTRLTKDPYDGQHLPIDELKFVKQDTAFQFDVTSSKEEEPIPEDELEEEEDEDEERQEQEGERRRGGRPKMRKKVFHLEYDLATGQLRDLGDEYEKEPERPEWASISPDGSTIVFGRHFNLYMMRSAAYETVLEDKKAEVEEVQLTTEGEQYYSFTRSQRGRTDKQKEKDKDKRQGVSIVWAQDSGSFALIRNDQREVGDLWVINSIADPRPTLETYKYDMPGEKTITQRELWVFDVAAREGKQIEIEAFPDQTVSILRKPAVQRPPGSTRSSGPQPNAPQWLSADSNELYFSRTSRDMHRIDIARVNVDTGTVDVVIEERLNTYLETQPLRLVNDGQQLIHWSERDGWGHYYLYNRDGSLVRQLTSGPYSCRGIVGIDDEADIIFFNATGREEGEDPYYTHLYRINLDGTGLQLLNAGEFTHTARMPESGGYFINTSSRVDTVPESALFLADGSKVMDLETADITRLREAGFRFPERFKVKADDGVTDLYGVMWKPFDFDASKKYPIIAFVYPGPQTESVPKAFRPAENNMALAQFGFVVIAVGNRGGHPHRSKWYHNYGYGNLRDYGLADKKATIEQLAALHSYIDIDRVGIYGHSGGGFMSTAALLVYPDFFKVAVSSSGNHENNVYNRRWSEMHHGVKEVVNAEGEVSFEYSIEKNSELAKNLKGRLLLLHGDIDNNVHPANTMRLVNALIQANKRFDMLILPGRRHGFGPMNNYVFWLRADYFCKHLIGDYSASVDMVELNREVEQTGERGGGGSRRNN